MTGKEAHPLFNAAYNNFVQGILEVPLSIIVLGPGKSSPGYDKRQEIKRHLQDTSAHYDVAFIEDLRPVEASQADSDPMESIAFYVANADITFALTVDHPSVSGVLTEITYFRRNRKFLDTTCVITPKRQQAKRFGRMPLIKEQLRVFPSSQRLEYSPEEFADCTKIRAWVAAKANERRRRKKYGEFLKEKGIEPPALY